ncbi:MAG TPA: DUF6282 family protein [Chloroflexota bacterium]|nr:DUF6282 family protein [Chloroflexota bacterium]
MVRYDDFLRGAIDLHCHIDVELSLEAYRKREPEWEWLPHAERLGMRGVVLKSHWWPTTGALPYLRQLYTGPVAVWASAVLNPVAGGPTLWAAEAAAALGARVIFLPTWGARNDLARRGFSARIAPLYESFIPEELPGCTFLDAAGAVSASGRALLEFCHRRGLTLATGHVSWQESLAFAEAAQALGFPRLIITHPLSAVIEMPLEVARRAAALGAWLEVCWNNVAPGRLDPAHVVDWIRAVGVEHVVASTDYFRGANPNPPELFRQFLGTLFDAGLTEREVRQIACENPARALGLDS